MCLIQYITVLNELNKGLNKRIHNVTYLAHTQGRQFYYQDPPKLFSAVFMININNKKIITADKKRQTIQMVASSNIRGEYRTDPSHWWLVEKLLTEIDIDGRSFYSCSLLKEPLAT